MHIYIYICVWVNPSLAASAAPGACSTAPPSH